MISRHDEIEKEIMLLTLRVRQSDGGEKKAYQFCLKRQYNSLRIENERIGGDFEPDFEQMDEYLACAKKNSEMKGFT